MDVQLANNLMFALTGILVFVICLLLIGRSKAMDREHVLQSKINLLNAKLAVVHEAKMTAEKKVLSQASKLEKIHLLNFSEWLFDDSEFMTKVSNLVDELLPAALERYNAANQEKMRLQAEKWAENSRLSIAKSELKSTNDRKITSNSAGESTVSMAAMSMDTSFSDTGSCASDSSSCM